jgi:hypothetical protein
MVLEVRNVCGGGNLEVGDFGLKQNWTWQKGLN